MIQRLLAKPVYVAIAALVVLFALFFCYQLFGQMFKGRELSSELDAQVQQSQQLQKEQSDLKSKLDYYKSGGYDEYAEQRAREDLNLSREGDVVLLPVPFTDTAQVGALGTATAAVPGESGKQAEGDSFFDKIGRLFGR
jgi:cell division protein FtsB